MRNHSPLTAGSILENRYRIVRQLGRGGCGRTYLAEDINRYNEACVLKEFAPQVRGTQALQKATELFQREAGMLYKLQHPQIPRFRELICISSGKGEFLFLVQEYIEGQTYWELLTQRQQQGKQFTKTEVTQLLLQLLPVLEYLHSQKVIHRDISPDNLIQRSSDKLPVLIDFGGVKEVEATTVSKLMGQHSGTALGKVGYSPDEQMREGKAFPGSDLYALGVTVLVLLTGKPPQDLYDSAKATWRWGRKVNSRSSLRPVLEKMLADRPSDRFHSAREVRQALADPSLSPKRNVLSLISTLKLIGRLRKLTGQSFPTKKGRPRGQTPQRSASKTGKTSHPPGFGKVVAIGIGTVLLSLTGLVALVAIDSDRWKLQLPKLPKMPVSDAPLPTEGDRATPRYHERSEKLYRRVETLNLDEGIFIQKVNQLFYAQNPAVKGRQLTDKLEDAELRQQWLQIAEALLDRLEEKPAEIAE